MTTPACDRSDQGNVKTSKRRGLAIVLLLLTSAALVAGIGRYAWYRPTIPEPPAVELAGVDPAIVAAVEKAQAAVRARPHSASSWGNRRARPNQAGAELPGDGSRAPSGGASGAARASVSQLRQWLADAGEGPASCLIESHRQRLQAAQIEIVSVL
jgi:hypothetical protein